MKLYKVWYMVLGLGPVPQRGSWGLQRGIFQDVGPYQNLKQRLGSALGLCWLEPCRIPTIKIKYILIFRISIVTCVCKQRVEGEGLLINSGVVTFQGCLNNRCTKYTHFLMKPKFRSQCGRDAESVLPWWWICGVLMYRVVTFVLTWQHLPT